jgi:hypothetical protein
MATGVSESLRQIAEGMATAIEQIKQLTGHGEHEGWSNVAPKDANGWPIAHLLNVTHCGCGAVLLDPNARRRRPNG